MKRIMTLVVVAALAVLTGACSIDVERNEDGSLQLTTVLTEESLTNEIARGIDDPNVKLMTVDMKNGYALVELEADRESGFGTDNISFRVDLFVDNDHLGANVTNAVWNDIPLPQDLVDIWNEELAAQLEADAKEDPNSTLVAVELTEDALTMEFRHETEESRS